MSTNISKQKREDLLNKIKEIRNFISAAPQDENTGNLLSYLCNLERDVNGKKYGLVFEEHREEIDDILDTYTPVLTENKDLFINNDGQMNFLIEGDNLASLKLLEKTHKDKIDLIYIDPPYNTGNKDFIYSDIFVDSLDSFKHSKWLSFMKKRLLIARRLLSRKGIIFISIDDNEVAQLKLLCDEIFGNDNFRGQIVRGTGTPTGQGNAILSNEIDYILVYAKTEQAIFNGLPFNSEDAKIYNLEDEYGKYLVRPLRKTGGEDRREDRPSMYYPVTAPDGTQIYPIAPLGYESRWRCQEKTYKQLIDDHRIEWKQDKTGWKVYQKFYLDGRTKQVGNLWIDIEGNKKATITMRNIFGENIFSFPKPVELIYRIAQIASYKNSCILDFFSGSGTTGHAVMKLNAEDGGNRKFILCTNNENNICRDVTYERIKRVIDKEGYAASLKYYKIDYVPISDRLYYEYADELLKHIRELVELENVINFTGNTEIAIVLTEEELDNFISQLENSTKCQKLYLGYDILMDAQQAQTLKDRKITVNIIPDYYYKELEG
ncbi:site-specific DNA-methyltransferase [Waltera sp.]|uniref:site-specific DNA-methyltransferase n=1 Tax=Waltera sp. TaxID=2815806 RepID=UPI0039A3E545